MTDPLTDSLTDTPTHQPTLIDWLSDWLADWFVSAFTGWFANWLADCLTHSLVDWLINWLSDWPADWLTDSPWYSGLINQWGRHPEFARLGEYSHTQEVKEEYLFRNISESIAFNLHLIIFLTNSRFSTDLTWKIKTAIWSYFGSDFQTDLIPELWVFRVSCEMLHHLWLQGRHDGVEVNNDLYDILVVSDNTMQRFHNSCGVNFDVISLFLGLSLQFLAVGNMHL